MAKSNKNKARSVKLSKIVKYKLEEDCVNLRKQGFSYQAIADELNSSGKVPDNDSIDKFVISRFLEKMPEVTRALIKEDKGRLMKVVNTSFDVYYEINSLFGKTKAMLEFMEEEAASKGKLTNPYKYKAIVSEMREMLKQMTEIQKEVNDYNNVRKFMEIVLGVLQTECPEKLPIIIERLKVVRDTKWFADMMKHND